MINKLKKYFFKLYQKLLRGNKKEKFYPRGYSNKELEKEVDKFGDSDPISHLGSSYYSRASLGLTELQRRSSNLLGWSTVVISVLALIISAKALRYTEVQSRSDRILQSQSINRALENCKNNPKLEESGIYITETGKPASCLKIIELYGGELSILYRIKINLLYFFR